MEPRLTTPPGIQYLGQTRAHPLRVCITWVWYSTYAAFVDYAKAFDLVNRTSLWKKLLHNDINGKVFTVINNMYTKAKSCVKSNNNISEFFASKCGVRQGDNLSPLLFAIYINDFESFLSKRYKGLSELAEDITELLSDNELRVYLRLYTLLYADDTVILAESEKELQMALDGLEDYCALWNLTVNLDKTKIIIFSRGKIRKHGPFTFGGEPIEVVYEYIYLGLTISHNNSFTKAIQKQLTLARKAQFSLLSKVKKLNLPIDLQLNLFDKLVLPVLTYGCEIWGIANLKEIEVFHRKFIKNVLSISKYTANPTCYGETGREPIINTIYQRVITFWVNIKQGETNKISTIIYRLLRKLFDLNIYQSKWCKKVSEILNNLGLSYLWNRNNISKNQVKTHIKSKLKDITIQEWRSNMNGNILCQNYRLLKEELKFEHYITVLDSDLRIAMTKFRTGSHQLPISIKRYNPIDDRNVCPLCALETGDEYHYVLVCPSFEYYRKLYIPAYYSTRPNTIKFKELFSLNDKMHLSKLA